MKLTNILEEITINTPMSIKYALEDIVVAFSIQEGKDLETVLNDFGVDDSNIDNLDEDDLKLREIITKKYPIIKSITEKGIIKIIVIRENFKNEAEDISSFKYLYNRGVDDDEYYLILSKIKL